MNEPLDVNVDSRGVCQLTLNRPRKGNALDGSLVAQLLKALVQIRADPAVRLLLLTGQGGMFCSGADLQWMQQMAAADVATNTTDALELAELLETLARLPLPTVARINGPAYGGGVGLVCACDIAIASEMASFTFSEVRLGLVPAVIAPYVIAAVGLRHVRRWFLSAETMDSKVAQQLGLVHQVVSTNELDEAVERQLQLLLKGGAQAQAQIKRIAGEGLTRPYDKEAAGKRLAEIRASEEAQEGLRAFLEKRKPRWLR